MEALGEAITLDPIFLEQRLGNLSLLDQGYKWGFLYKIFEF